MGQIIYNKVNFSYDEAEHKSLLQLLCEQKLLSDSQFSGCNDEDKCGRCKVYIFYGNAIFQGMVRSLSNEVVLACECTPIGDIALRSVEDEEIVESTEVFDEGDIGLAVDLGQIAAVFYFYNLKEESIITIQLVDNHARGLALIEELIVRTIKTTALTYCFDMESIKRIVVAENFGLREVYTNETTLISPPPYFFPPLAKRVDGNITAGVYYCNLDKTSLTKLFLDIGTSGEICLSHNKKLYCTAVDNIQVFSGLGISCGMGGQTGGIFGAHVYSNGEIDFSTVNDTIPIGICGTGMIDLLVILHKLGEVDECGKLQGCEEYTFADENEDGPRIYFTQEDIDLILDAKAGICAGIHLLLDAVGISLSDVDELVFGGDFGMKPNFTNVCELGLLPTEFIQKYKWEGNVRGLAGGKLLHCFSDKKRISDFAEACEYIDVIGSPKFKEAALEYRKL